MAPITGTPTEGPTAVSFVMPTYYKTGTHFRCAGLLLSICNNHSSVTVTNLLFSLYLNLPLIQYRIQPVHQVPVVQMVHPQMKVKDAEIPFRILSMEDAHPALIVDSATLLLVNPSVALSPIG